LNPGALKLAERGHASREPRRGPGPDLSRALPPAFRSESASGGRGGRFGRARSVHVVVVDDRNPARQRRAVRAGFHATRHSHRRAAAAPARCSYRLVANVSPNRVSDDRNGRLAIVWVGTELVPAFPQERAVRDVNHPESGCYTSHMANSAFGAERADELLFALGEQLAAASQRFDLVVIGGSALLALGLVERATRDVDVLALVGAEGLIPADPLPEPLAGARDRVAQDFGLPAGWLNPGPTELLRFGLPDGFLSRVETRTYGSALTVFYAGRLDQIHLKLYAMVDQGAGRHEADLRALEPTSAELLSAARRTRTHDPSEGFRQELVAVLAHLGVTDADLDA
jgi:hypothetical protein